MELFKARTPRPVDPCALGADSARIPDLMIYGTGFLPIRRKPLPPLTPLIPCPGVSLTLNAARKFRSVTDEFQR